MKSFFSLIVLFSLTAIAVAAGNESVPLNFRDWTHTKSMVISDKSHGLYGFHHIYANDKALKISKKGTGVYEDGAQYVVSFYEVETQGAMTSQGAKIMDVSMRKDSKGAAVTGGWHYEAFDAAGTRKKIDVMKDCHSCHQGVAATDFVFSTYIP
jgi:hypothetical protein